MGSKKSGLASSYSASGGVAHDPFLEPAVVMAWRQSLHAGDQDRLLNVYPGVIAWGNRLPHGSVVLDVGAGDGECDQLFGTNVARTILVEPSAMLLEVARNRRYEQPRDRHFHQASGQDLSVVPDASIDGALSVRVFHHLPPPILAATLLEMGRVLKPDGQAYIATAHPDAYDVWRGKYGIAETGITEEGTEWWRGPLRYRSGDSNVFMPDGVFYAHPTELLEEHVALAGLQVSRTETTPPLRQTSMALVLEKP